MVDWLDISFPLTRLQEVRLRRRKVFRRPGAQWGKRFLKLDSNDVPEWEKKIPEQISSDSTSVFVDLSCGKYGNCLRISGNLHKWILGQNVFGELSPEYMVAEFLKTLPQYMGGVEIEMPPLFLIKLHRIDLTQSVYLDSEDDVLDCISVLGYIARRRRSKNACDGTTVYFGKSSGEWATKYYSKYYEVKRKPQEGIDPEQIRGLLRCEHVLRKHIARNFWTFKDFCSKEFRDKVYIGMFDYVTIPEKQMETRMTHESLPKKLRPVWREWVSGTDMKSFFASKATLYRWRAALLEHGIDILGPVNLFGAQEKKNLVPFALLQLRKSSAWASAVRKAA